MIDSVIKVFDLEREMYIKDDLTEREKVMLEAIQYLLGVQGYVDYQGDDNA